MAELGVVVVVVVVGIGRQPAPHLALLVLKGNGTVMVRYPAVN